MEDLAAKSDPSLIGDAFPKGALPYTGDPAVVDDLVVRVIGAAHQFSVNAREGMTPEDNLSGLRVVIDGVTAVLEGKDHEYNTLPWQVSDLPGYLTLRYGMQGAPDPVAGYLTRLALNVVKLYRDWQMGVLDDSTAESQIGGLKFEATRDLLGLPDERGSHG